MAKQVTFFQGRLPAAEWDGDKKAAKFSFSRRFLTTADKKLIALLDSRGYQRVKPGDTVTDEGTTPAGNVMGTSTAAPDAAVVRKAVKASGSDRIELKGDE